MYSFDTLTRPVDDLDRCLQSRTEQDAGIVQRQNASVYLKTPCDAGVLKEVKAGREKLFINPRLMTLLTAGRDKPSLPAKARIPLARR